MNCCNDFGTCEQGLGCPCSDDVKPVAVARVKANRPRACAELGACNCATADHCESDTAPYAPGVILRNPTEPYVNPMTALPTGDSPLLAWSRREWVFVCGCLLVLVVCSLAVITGSLGYLWVRWLA